MIAVCSTTTLTVFLSCEHTANNGLISSWCKWHTILSCEKAREMRERVLGLKMACRAKPRPILASEAITKLHVAFTTCHAVDLW